MLPLLLSGLLLSKGSKHLHLFVPQVAIGRVSAGVQFKEQYVGSCTLDD